MNKSEIRKKILKARKLNYKKNLVINFKYIFEILKKHKKIGRAVGGYYPYNYEINPMQILEKFEKKNYQISLPKIKKKFQMDFFQWSTKEPLSINKFGIPEPISNKIVHPNIFLVPLVAFDKNLNRIGYGGGFYDRYIEKITRNKKVITIGLAFSFQKVKKVPINKHDFKLDYIVTEKGN